MVITDVFTVLIYQPLYNTLIVFSSVLPGASVGASVILLTIIVRFVILPISHKSVKTQVKIRELDPKIKEIRKTEGNNKEAQATQIMNLYKEHGVNPFSGCLFALVQLPIIFGLYWVFWKGLSDGVVNPELIYSFVEVPEVLNFNFLKAFELTEPSVLFAILAGASQFIQMKLALPATKKDEPKKSKAPNFAEEMKKNMTTQMKYVLPVVIAVVSLQFPAAVPLYWTTSNIFSISHEVLVRRNAKKIILQSKSP